MSGWRLAPLRRLRAHEARGAALELAAALAGEAGAAREVARRLERARTAVLTLGPGGPVPAAALVGAAACAGRHAADLEEARVAVLRAAGEVERRRVELASARGAARSLGALEARWAADRRRRRERAAESALDDLPRPGRWRR